MAKFLHCVGTACILRTQRLGYSPKNTCHLSSSMAKQQSPHENNENAFNLEINCRYEQATQPCKVSTHISWPRNVIMSHFLAKKCYQPVGSVITFLRREIVTPITDINPAVFVALWRRYIGRIPLSLATGLQCGAGPTLLLWHAPWL